MIAAIIQARMGSSRLPGKVLEDVGGITAIEHLVKQIRAATKIDQIILTTSALPRDNLLVRKAEEMGLAVFRGDEDNIMHRLLGAAEMVGADVVVRVLGDCPLSDPQIIDVFVDELIADPDLDMVTNQHPHSYPDGYDISVMTIEALRNVCREISENGYPEHLSVIWREDTPYHVRNMEAAENYFSNYRATLDYPEDLDVIRKIVTSLGGAKKVLYLRDVLDYLQNNPSVTNLNKRYIDA